MNFDFGHGPSTLLAGFINERLHSYVEPTRQGTPKGERIGMSRDKYAAVLLTLTNIPLKERGEMLGKKGRSGLVVLSTWGAQPEFQREAEKALSEFSGIVIQRLREIVYNMRGEPEAFRDSLGAFADSGTYSEEIFSGIIRRMIAEEGIERVDSLDLRHLLTATDALFFRRTTFRQGLVMACIDRLFDELFIDVAGNPPDQERWEAIKLRIGILFDFWEWVKE